MNLAHITPQTKIEETILMDLNLANEHGDPILNLIEDVKEDPNAYGYNSDDLNQFLFKYEIL